MNTQVRRDIKVPARYKFIAEINSKLCTPDLLVNVYADRFEGEYKRKSS